MRPNIATPIDQRPFIRTFFLLTLFATLSACASTSKSATDQAVSANATGSYVTDSSVMGAGASHCPQLVLRADTSTITGYVTSSPVTAEPDYVVTMAAALSPSTIQCRVSNAATGEIEFPTIETQIELTQARATGHARVIVVKNFLEVTAPDGLVPVHKKEAIRLPVDNTGIVKGAAAVKASNSFKGIRITPKPGEDLSQYQITVGIEPGED